MFMIVNWFIAKKMFFKGSLQINLVREPFLAKECADFALTKSILIQTIGRTHFALMAVIAALNDPQCDSYFGSD